MQLVGESFNVCSSLLSKSKSFGLTKMANVYKNRDDT